MIPAVLVAGTHSGVGKTTVVLGLMAALKRRGLEVQPFKVGPDFIDPTHHTAICGRTSRNLDTFMMGEEGVRRSFSSGMKGADVAVIEGVMGLYDGLEDTEVASSAHVAKALKVPVILVINVHGMSRSAAALALGYTRFDPQVKIAGLILNRVGSERHLSMIQKVMDLPILGALPQKKNIFLPSRHLGLTMGFESDHDLDRLADLIEENADLDKILELRCELPPARPLPEPPDEQVKIGVAYDEAFCFYYQENFDELKQLGAEIVFFSPMKNEMPDVDGLYLGGGYPELYAKALEDAKARHQIKGAADDGMPIYGECGGLMYLEESVISEDSEHEMVGVLPATTIMTKRLQALGYVEGDVIKENPIVEKGRSIRGHEFHYSKMDCARDAHFAYKFRRGKGILNNLDGLTEHNTLGSYLHTHVYSYPMNKFVESCRNYKKK
ncbi:MAG: cobyrinate a,c-diamide synthase [Methanotrichaceae archaeon]